MRSEYILESMKALLPVIIIFSYLFISGHLSSDYYFHLGYDGSGDYPPFLSWLLPPFGNQQRSLALFAINLLSTTAIPFILIHRITGMFEAGWAYLFSGIPLVLFTVWLVPQSLLHILILSSIAFPPLLIPFLALGWLVHSYWWAGWLLAMGYYFYSLGAKK